MALSVLVLIPVWKISLMLSWSSVKKLQLKLQSFHCDPFPGTAFWEKIKSENRFIETDWRKFNCANVVFKPKHTTEKQLRDGFVMLWREFFSKVDYEESLSSFHQKLENILKSREFSQKVKDAVSRGIKQNQIKLNSPSVQH